MIRETGWLAPLMGNKNKIGNRWMEKGRLAAAAAAEKEVLVLSWPSMWSSLTRLRLFGEAGNYRS